MKNNPLYKLEWSAVATIIGILFLFIVTIFVVLVAPNYVDPSWTSPSSSYQKQMYEIADPNLYISSSNKDHSELQFVYHIKKDFTLLAFQENEVIRFVAPKELQKYITKNGENILKLTSELILLREPIEGNDEFNGKKEAEKLIENIKTAKQNETSSEADPSYSGLIILELYRPNANEGFAIASTEGVLENWVDSNFTILDDSPKQKYHKDSGVIYVNNPIEYKIKKYKFGNEEGWKYDPNGIPIADIQELKGLELGFKSRHELIYEGEHIYAIEGCWYCHSDQTRTLVQDVVVNGNEDYPAPPSTANEYIYQEITFPATRRIGPDLSRVGIKKPNRDWHKSHFWSPKTASKGSIMPAFQHFFDNDPRGSRRSEIGVPNYKFESIFQYLMTKGTRITPPTQAWWQGKDPVQTKEIIEGRKVLK